MMRNFLLLICSICCLWNCSSEEGETTGSIYGVVTLSGFTEPMSAMGVELYYENALLLKTVTYDDGHYEFDNIQPGNYQLRIVSEGYENVKFDVVVEAGRTARADMQMVRIYTQMIVNTVTVDIKSKGEVFLKSTGKNDSYELQPVDAGFMYGKEPNPSRGGTRVSGELRFNNSYQYYFSANVTGLEKGTYYVQAYAKNSLGTEYGEVSTFQISGDPEVTTLASTNISANTATLNGKIEYAGSPAYTEKGFVYSSSFPTPTVDDPQTATKKIAISGTSSEFSANVAELEENKVYYVRAYVVSENGVFYGRSVEFMPSQKVDLDYYILSSVNLMVQKVDMSSGATWETASNLCKSSNVGGFSDWRLPTRGELNELYCNQSIIGKLTGNYWSGEKNPNYNDCYYYYRMINATQDYAIASSSLKVRAVRTILK